MIINALVLAAQNIFAQHDSLILKHHPEKLWYLQKETWLVGLIVFLIVIIGLLYRASRLKKTNPKTIFTSTTHESTNDVAP